MYAALTSGHSSTGFAPSDGIGLHIKLSVDLLTTSDVKDLQDKPKNHSQQQTQLGKGSQMYLCAGSSIIK